MRMTKRIIAGISLFIAGACMSVEGVYAQPVSQESLPGYSGNNAGIYRDVDNRTGVYKAKYKSGGKTTTEWCYLVNGEVQYKYTGFASNSKGWWYVEKGKVTLKKNDVIKGKVDGQDGWWLVKGSQVQFIDSVEKNSLGWWVIQKGKVNFDYTGFAKNSSGWWYAEKGKVNFNKNDVIKGKVNGQDGWWFVKGGMVQFVDSVEKNSSGWWVIQKGKVNFDYTGFAKNSSGWWYAEKGKINFNKSEVTKGKVNGTDGWWVTQNGQVKLNYTGFAKNLSGWWYCEKGKVNLAKNDVLKGTVDGKSGWWYVKGGKVQFVDTVAKNSSGWWAIFDGQVDFSYYGVAENSSGTWYCNNGKVDFNYNGTLNTVGGRVYTFKNGKAVSWYENIREEAEAFISILAHVTNALDSWTDISGYISSGSTTYLYSRITRSYSTLKYIESELYEAYKLCGSYYRFEKLKSIIHDAYNKMPVNVQNNYYSLSKFLTNMRDTGSILCNECHDELNTLASFFEDALEK